MIKLICKICDKEYFKEKRKAEKSKYCSWSCLWTATGLRNRGRIVTEQERFKARLSKLGNKNPAKRPEVKVKLRENHYDCRLEKNPSWKGGVSFKKYPFSWQNKLKWKIRKRDGYRCIICGTVQKELRVHLHIHHIDYNKDNLNENNLVSVCNSCHAQTNFDREFWIIILKERIGGYMDSKEVKKKVEQYKEAKKSYRDELLIRDRTVHGENSTVKYDPSTGSLKQEK